MATWSTKRKYGFFFLFVLILVILIGVPAVYFLYKKPTCFDGKQNGTERGIDCSGSCPKLCPADFAEPRVLWSYSMRVVPGVYNSIAYVQNPNPVEAKSVPYVFRIYDDKGVQIAERKGNAFVPAGQKFAIFQGGIELEQAPARTTFEFGAVSSWRQGEIFSKLKVVRTDLDQGTSPRAEVTIKNYSLDKDVGETDAFIILYDADDNRVAFSKTVIEGVPANESRILYFTWPESFSKSVVRTEMLFTAKPKK
jgi:hypothetical protein